MKRKAKAKAKTPTTAAPVEHKAETYRPWIPKFYADGRPCPITDVPQHVLNGVHPNVLHRQRSGSPEGPVWVEWKRQFAKGIQADDQLYAAFQAKHNPGYHSKVVLEPANESGVQVGGSSEVKRVKWNGHSGFALARWCGAAGWTGAEAVGVFEAIGIPMGKSAIIGGVYAGKAGTRGDPAPVTEAQAKVLEAERAKVAPGSKPKAKASPKVEAPAPAPKATGKGSRRKNKQAKIDAALRDRKEAQDRAEIEKFIASKKRS